MEQTTGSKAIVLSGGGAVGIAWQTGLVAGLAERGVDLASAELVVGTSAGAAVGAQIALGCDMRAALERFAALKPSGADAPAGGDPAARPSSQGRLQKLFAIMAEVAAKGGDAAQSRAALGRFALEAETIDEASFMKSFSYLANERWPRRFACTAVDAESGDFMVWRESSGVDLWAAVSSSCAVPGLFPPITIAGRRYMDGGMRSGTNADLAKGHQRVLILSLMAAAGTGESSGDAELDPRRLRMRRNAERELATLREAGGRVEVVGPDAEAAAIMGMDLMNHRLAYDAAQAGLRQGRAAAPRLGVFWG